MKARKSSARPVLVLLLMGFLLLSAGVLAAPGTVAGADPEPWIDPNLQYYIDPGPGWPQGWTPPPKPTEIPQEAVDEFNEVRSLPVTNRPERHELRVLDPMPPWTNEYPYFWNYIGLICGKTYYAYMYPEPDVELLRTTTGDVYLVGMATRSSAQCLFGPVAAIQKDTTPDRTAEQAEQQTLRDLLDEHIWWARGGTPEAGGLQDCVGDSLIGSADNIPVCFNSGLASDRFDVSAYLDPEVGRVRVPVRFVSELMGAVVSWSEANQTVTIDFPALQREVVQPVSRPGYQTSDWWIPDDYSLDLQVVKFERKTVVQQSRRIVLQVGSPTALVDGVPVTIDAPPVIRKDRVMIPVRFVSQALGAKVYWVGDQPIWKRHNGGYGGQRQVHIYTRFWPFYENPSWFLETKAMGF